MVIYDKGQILIETYAVNTIYLQGITLYAKLVALQLHLFTAV